MAQESEIYTFLGLQNRAHFYLHNAHEGFDMGTSYQIYNVLISEGTITSPKDVVIIYEIRGDNCDVVVIGHEGGQPIPKVDKENLEQFFPVLMTAKRDDLSVIKYCYVRKCYLTYHVKNTDFTNILGAEVSPLPISIRAVIVAMTSKPF
jgi:hypothetical protein